jgi:uncharacterized SAM-binding protein YcdF (DUF218 family)
LYALPVFELSKLSGPLLDPRVVLFALLIFGTVLLWTRRTHRGARTLVTTIVLIALVCAVLPVGPAALAFLEDRFPAPAVLPERVDGIVVLGGDFNTSMAEARGPLAAAPPRLMAFANLAREYPDARLIFSGGAGTLSRPDLREADQAPALLAYLGLDPQRVIFERESRNTVENAEFTYKVAKPKAGEVWLLVTSAFHMPRAMGTFRRAGWTVVPYPVDYQTGPGLRQGLRFGFDGGLTAASVALHEYLGLAVYYALGRTDALLPGP